MSCSQSSESNLCVEDPLASWSGGFPIPSLALGHQSFVKSLVFMTEAVGARNGLIYHFVILCGVSLFHSLFVRCGHLLLSKYTRDKDESGDGHQTTVEQRKSKWKMAIGKRLGPWVREKNIAPFPPHSHRPPTRTLCIAVFNFPFVTFANFSCTNVSGIAGRLLMQATGTGTGGFPPLPETYPPKRKIDYELEEGQVSCCTCTVIGEGIVETLHDGWCEERHWTKSSTAL